MRMTLRSALLISCLLIALPALAQEDSDAPPPAAAYATSAAANLDMRMSAVEDQLRALTGKTEQLDYTLRRLDQAMQRMQGDYDARLTKLETAPPPVAQPVIMPQPALAQPQPMQPGMRSTTVIPPNAPPANVSVMGGQPAPGTTTNEAGDVTADPDTAVKGTLGALKLQGGQVTGAVAKPQAPALPQTPDDYGLNPQEQYDRAYQLMLKGQSDDAEKAFKGFIDKNPQDKMIDRAKYWYAETFYVRSKYPEAAVAFAEAFQQNPKGPKAPDSLLKLAMSLAKIDKVPDACNTLDGLRAKFPQAPASTKAQAAQQYAELKCKAAAAAQ